MPVRVPNEWNWQWIKGMARTGALGLLAVALIACEAQPPSPHGERFRAQAHLTVTGTAAVTLVNNPPDAVDDMLTVAEDSTDTVVSVLANDSTAPDTGETLTVTDVTQPAGGAVTLSGGVLRFTPVTNFSGTTSFSYTVSDGNGGTDTAMVTVTVTAVNDPPTATPDSFTVTEDSAPMMLDVLANDTPAPDTGEFLTIESVTPSAHGSVTPLGEMIRYQPAVDFHGTDTFMYTVSDGNGLTDTVTVTVTVTPVNDPPSAVDDTLAVAKNSTDTVINVLANDTTAPDTGETLTVTEVYPATSGTVTLTGGVVRYSAPAGFIGTDTFGYTVSDGNGGTTSATVTVNVMPSGTGGWSTTGPLAIARIWHTATLLSSGKVLVAGGDGIIGGGPLASAELYDPDTGTWSTTGNLAAERVQHTATLLPSGKVLVTGGAIWGGPPTSAELYDPDTGTWSSTGSMITARLGHTATLLPSGKVLVTGGDGWGTPLASAELYDPGTGTWSSTGSMTTARWHHTATLLPSGKVLVTGGKGSTQTSVTSAEVYDPGTGTWSSTGSMATARWFHTATLLPSGKILVTGGEDSTSPSLASAEEYDPGTGAWSSAGSMATARAGHGATVLPSGRVLVIGGWDSNNSLASAEVYDPDMAVWSTTGDMVTDRTLPTATLLPSGQVLVTGEGVDPRLRAEVYREFTAPDTPVVEEPAHDSTISDSTPAYSGTADAGSTVTVIVDGVAVGNTTAGTTGRWSLAPPVPLADGPHTVKATATNTGGTSPDSNTNTFTVAGDPSTGGWSTTGALVTARTGHTATVLPSGKVLVTGGEDSSGALASAEMYDPSTGGWSSTGALATARTGHTATVLPSGKVLVTGGEGSDGFLANAELYDPATGTWSTANSLSTARTGHTATVLPSGKVLVTGGEGSSDPLASAELYDPATGTWSTTGTLATARTGHTATVLPSGKVLVTGGEGSSGPLASAELYDPATGTWSATSPLATARQGHSATALLSGQVLVTGGQGSSGLLSSTELYDPATESWSTTGALATARRNPSAVLLPSGRVLITGSEGPGGALSSTEVYAPSTGVWSPTGLLATARKGHTATVLPSGHVLITGGVGASGLLASVEMYEAVGASRPAAPLPEARTDFMTVLLPNGLVLVAGGSNSNGPLASARLYNPFTGLWAEAADMGTPRAGATATLLPTGQVLVTGGRAVAHGGLRAPSASAGEVLSSAELYDPVANTWRDTGSLNDARYSHSATLLSTGQVLVTGGLNANDTLCTTAEVYDVASGAWLQTSPMNTARRQHMVAQLSTGQVLVAGGLDAEDTALSSAEVYDPVQKKWTPTAPMSTARAASTAVPLPTSQVMVVGGTTDGRDALSTAEVYDPVRREWVLSEPLNKPRKSHTALLLPTGRVLIMGGSDGSSVLAEVEVYDTARDRWEKLAQLTGPREDSMTVQLSTGQVLVLGGKDLLGPLENSELYDEFGPPDTLRPVVDELPPQRPVDRPTVQGRGFMAPPGGSARVRMQLAPRGALRDLPAEELTDISVRAALAGVPDGFHLLFVMVNDIAGGRVVQVDGTPPAAPSVKAFTGTPQPTLSGKAEPHSMVLVSLRGQVEGTARVDFKGDWHLPLTTVLEDGTYTASATAMDVVGNPSPPSAPFAFTVDTQAPAAPVVEPLDAFIKNPRPTLGGTAEPGSTVTVWLDGEVLGTAPTDTLGRWSFPLPQALEDGPHTASATATDQARNTGLSSTVITFTVDTQAPVAPEMLTPEEGATMVPGTVTISGTAEPDSTVTVLMDREVQGEVRAGSEGAWSLTIPTGLENGERMLSATATDAAGNGSPPSVGRSFTVDNGDIVVPDGGCQGCASSPGEPSLVLLGLAALRRLLSRRRLTRA
jgi:N-acetylneuraminic acid mutarotase